MTRLYGGVLLNQHDVYEKRDALGLRVFLIGEEGGIGSLSRFGDPQLKRKARLQGRAFRSGGEGGRPSQSHPDEPIILLPGTSVQEALLIIDNRQKCEFEEPPSG